MRQLLVIWMFLFAGLGAKSAAAYEGTVYTVNYPLNYFAETIAGDVLEIVFPVPDDIDPAYWSPGIEELVAFQSADLVLLNGAGYASWLKGISLPRSRLIDTSKNYADRLIRSEGASVHSHGPEGTHAHNGRFAFTTWLDIALAREQALAIKNAFVKRWPDLEDGFILRYQALDTDLKVLEEKMMAAFEPMKGRHVLASHPVYQYLARVQGLKMTSFHWEPDVTPSNTDWARFDASLADDPANLMIWEDGPTEATRRQLASRGIKIRIVPPLFQTPDTGDFISILTDAIHGF